MANVTKRKSKAARAAAFAATDDPVPNNPKIPIRGLRAAIALNKSVAKKKSAAKKKSQRPPTEP